MNSPDIEIPLSVIATVLALLSFCGEGWRLWRDRPRLQFYVSTVNFRNLPKFGDMEMVRFMVCNVGYRPIILTRFVAFGENSSFMMGIDDEPSAVFGVEDQKFPVLLEPGQTLKIHPTSRAIIERNAAKPEGDRVHYDPWKYFAIIDSFGRLHPVDIEDVKWRLRMITRRVRLKWWQKPGYWVTKRKFLWDARRRAAEQLAW